MNILELFIENKLKLFALHFYKGDNLNKAVFAFYMGRPFFNIVELLLKQIIALSESKILSFKTSIPV